MKNSNVLKISIQRKNCHVKVPVPTHTTFPTQAFTEGIIKSNFHRMRHTSWATGILRFKNWMLLKNISEIIS